MGGTTTTASAKNGSKKSSASASIEERFKKMSQHQHVLAEPDNYVSSPQMDEKEMFIMHGGAIISKKIAYTPALYKIYDEVLVNARDQTIRCKKCNSIKVTIKDDGWITVWNNGTGIPNEIHKEEKIYVATMIFGHLLTSGNYHQKGKTVGGKNGLGAKLANIFSKKFIFEGVDSKGNYLKQVWEDNMHTVAKPIFKKGVKSESYTQISFLPDYKRLDLPDGLTPDIRGLLQRRVWDVAACTSKSVKVSYNGKLVAVNDFKQYIKLHYTKPRDPDADSDDDSDADQPNDDDLMDEDGEVRKKPKSTAPKIIYDESPNWKVGVVYDPDNGGKQVSFVNGLNTFTGGTHVNDVLDRIVKKLTLQVEKKHKDLKLKASQIKDNISIFIDCVIEDPSFTAQIKDSLGTKVANFSSRFDVKDEYVKKLGASGLFDEAVAYAEMKQMEQMKKTDGKKNKGVKDIDKLEDAEKAGSRESHKCYLILTEGDSAKASAVGGLSVLGRNYYGVFPLQGKLLNVRETAITKIAKNKEIVHIKRIMGFQTGKKYTDVKELRYAGIIVMADQDHDGTHIKGLIMNMVHHFWPELIYDVPEFTICSLKTPIVKVGTNYFYSLQEFDQWKKDNNKIGKNCNEKYYKGLGTSTAVEAREWFVDFNNKLTRYVATDDTVKTKGKSAKSATKQRGASTDTAGAALNLAFHKKEADNRKKWLANYDPERVVDHQKTTITYDEFVHDDLIHYSNSSNIRAICRIVNGFKPSHSKILYTVKKRNLDRPEREMKVAQLAGAVAENTEYHHGEQSLVSAIAIMGQDFPCSGNNINLLYPSGQFGTRMKGGKDAASGRYIFTYMESITPLIFRDEDTPILPAIKDEVEPEYCPVIPMVLVNGSTGIGTGYNSNFLSYNPLDVIANCYRKISKHKSKEMLPWARSFSGTITKGDETGSYVCKARYTIDGDSVHVHDLPIGVWNVPYKQFLNKLMDAKNPLVDDYVSLCNDVKSEFIIKCVKGKIRGDYKDDREALEKKLKLVTYMNTNNMHAFNGQGRLHRYKTTEEVFDEFAQIRLDTYTRRKKYQLGLLLSQIEFLNWKIKFIEYYLDEKIVLVKRTKSGKTTHLKRADVINQLKKYKFPELRKPTQPDETPSYNYLTEIRIFDLTAEKMEELRLDHDDKVVRHKKLKKLSETDLWEHDLDELKAAYEQWNAGKLLTHANLARSKSAGESDTKKKQQRRTTSSKKK